MASTDVELEQQLKEAGKQLLHPSDSTDELLVVLDHVERLLSKVDQSPKKSMLDALKPLMKALIQDSLIKHSDVDTKVAVASCISDITRITAPDAPYDDDQMRDVFQLIVDSFEDLDDQYSRSFQKRAAILETVSKVRSCVIMLDLECDAMIVEMFEHLLKFVRNYHLESIIYSCMENIMVLVLEESEDISVEMLKPLLATVKKDSEGVLPIARKLAEGVLLKSADKLKPYLKPAVISLGHTLDNYTKIVAAVCEGTTATFQHDNENDLGPQKEDESKLEKGSTDEEIQVDDSKVTTASSEHTEQVVKEEDGPSEANPSPTVEQSPKSVMSNGVNVKDNGEASVDQEISKKQEQEVIINQENVHKEQSDDDDSDAEGKSKLAEEKSKLEEEKPKLEEEQPKLEEEKSKLEEETSKIEGEKDDIITNLTEITDSSHVEGEKEETNQPSSEFEKDNDVKESEIEIEKDNDVKMSEIEKDNDDGDDDNDDDDVQVSSPKPIETKPENVTVSSPAQSNSIPDEISVKKTVGSKKKQTPEQEEVSSPSKSETNPSEETRVKKPGRPKKNLTREDPTEETSAADVDTKPQKRAGKKTVIAKEVKQVSKDESDESDSDADKKEVKQVSKDESDDSDSDVKPLKKSVSKSTKRSGKKSKQSDAKKGKQSGKKVEDSDSDAKPLKQSVKKGDKGKITVDEDENESDDDDSDAELLKQSVKKGDKNKVTVEEDSESDDSDAKPSKISAKKGNLSKSKKRASGKNVAEKDQAKLVSSDDEMDSSPKSAATKSAKRKRSAGKEKVSDTIKYDKSLVGKKVKVWWPEDKMYYEGVVESFDSAKKKHKVSYVDGDEEKLNLKTQRWEIIQEFSVRDEVNEDQSEEATPEINKKKKSKTDSASQEKIKDSTKKGAKGSALKDKETPKMVNKSKGKSNSNGPTKEDVKTSESAKGKSTETAKTGSKKRKKRS